MKREAIIAEAASAILILLYGYTVISKATHFAIFQHALAGSLPTHGAAVTAKLVLLAEAVIVLLLFFPATRRTGFIASFVLLTVFTGYLLFMILSREKLPCGCGGVISELGWKGHIVFNVFFMGVSGVGVRSSGL